MTEILLEPLAVTITEATRLGVGGRSKIYEAITKGELEAVKDGNRTLILYASIKRRLESLPRIGRDVPMSQSPALAKGTAKRKAKAPTAA